MNRHFVCCGVVGTFGIVLFIALLRLPNFGTALGPLGQFYVTHAVPDLHVTNVVSAISYGYRGFDTMLEEFIFFAAIASVSIILRNTLEGNEEDVAAIRGRQVVERNDAVNLIGLIWVGLSVVLALSLILHGQLTPGGAFQGGAILGTALLTVFLVTSRATFERISPDLLIKIADSAGAGSFVLIGLIGAMTGAGFLANFLPLGDAGALLSGGVLWFINLAVAIEVSAGYALLFKEYLREVYDAGPDDERSSAEG